jgi:hypothetical protein
MTRGQNVSVCGIETQRWRGRRLKKEESSGEFLELFQYDPDLRLEAATVEPACLAPQVRQPGWQSWRISSFSRGT